MKRRHEMKCALCRSKGRIGGCPICKRKIILTYKEKYEWLLGSMTKAIIGLQEDNIIDQAIFEKLTDILEKEI